MGKTIKKGFTIIIMLAMLVQYMPAVLCDGAVYADSDVIGSITIGGKTTAVGEAEWRETGQEYRLHGHI